MGFQRRKDSQPQVTTAELGTMVRQSFTSLIEAIKTGNTNRLTSYLAFSSRFHHYSQRNQQLIYEQYPQATRVASYATWKQEGFHVRKMDKAKGEKGISILVPVFPAGYKKPDRRRPVTGEGEKVKPESEYTQNEITFITRQFRVGTVFDITHLIPEDQARVPTFFTEIEGDHEALYQRLVTIAKQDGIQVVETFATEGARGRSGIGIIQVRPDQPPGNKAAVIAHELVHEYEHDEGTRRNLSRQVKECHAEAGAYIVLIRYGIEIPYSVDYLRMWGNDEVTLRQELDVVTAAASKILTKLHALEPGEAHRHDEGQPEGDAQ